MRIVFMGTPEFAVPSLQALIESPWEVVGVFCQPDRPKGRSKTPQPCPVKQRAILAKIPVFQPERLRGKESRRSLEALAPDVIVVAAYGQILSQKILDLPRWGCINVHASLLPRWRGASPIHAALAAGDPETGVCIMQMTRGLDEGPVLSSFRHPIVPGMGRIELENLLAKGGARLIVETLSHIESLVPVPQDSSLVTYAPIIQKGMGNCQFEIQTAETLVRLAAAFEGWPQLMCQFRDISLKLLDVRIGSGPANLPAGQILITLPKDLAVACADGSWLQVHQLQPAGKKPMDAAAFINGYRPAADERMQSLTRDWLPFP